MAVGGGEWQRAAVGSGSESSGGDGGLPGAPIACNVVRHLFHSVRILGDRRRRWSAHLGHLDRSLLHDGGHGHGRHLQRRWLTRLLLRGVMVIRLLRVRHRDVNTLVTRTPQRQGGRLLVSHWIIRTGFSLVDY